MYKEEKDRFYYYYYYYYYYYCHYYNYCHYFYYYSYNCYLIVVVIHLFIHSFIHIIDVSEWCESRLGSSVDSSQNCGHGFDQCIDMCRRWSSRYSISTTFAIWISQSWNWFVFGKNEVSINLCYHLIKTYFSMFLEI